VVLGRQAGTAALLVHAARCQQPDHPLTLPRPRGEQRQHGVVVHAVTGQRVPDLVMATRHDAVPEGRDAELLIDIDLSILGAERARFDEYEEQVGREYAFVPLEIRLPRRREILQRFLDRDAIYATPRMHALLEVRARENLRRSIAG
jgi:predicted metal-dependent HD superfamily phosphohydrolase